MIEVRIRHEGEDAVHLCEVPFSEIDKVVAQVGSWSVYATMGDTGSSYGTEYVSGQFVVDDSGAYFEVIVGL